MAKYTRYDPRNKKSGRHKTQYLERGSMGRTNRERVEADDFDQMYEKYGLELVLKQYRN